MTRRVIVCVWFEPCAWTEHALALDVAKGSGTDMAIHIVAAVVEMAMLARRNVHGVVRVCRRRRRLAEDRRAVATAPRQN